MASMPNIATLLKSEISRVARKELRSETLSLKKATRTYRSEIAALKRRMQDLGTIGSGRLLEGKSLAAKLFSGYAGNLAFEESCNVWHGHCA